MRIQSTPQSSLPELSGTKSASSQASFQKTLDSKQNADLSGLKNDLKQVFMDLKSGKINEDQAGKTFVNYVLEKQNHLKLNPAILQKIQSTVGEFISHDPAFMSKLQTEFKKL